MDRIHEILRFAIACMFNPGWGCPDEVAEFECKDQVCKEGEKSRIICWLEYAKSEIEKVKV